jgi:hypothetical protein
MKKDSTPFRQNGDSNGGVNDLSNSAEKQPPKRVSSVKVEWSDESGNLKDTHINFSKCLTDG